MRARQWVPELGAFLSVDDLAFHDASSTFWGWPGQNPIATRDPSGHDGTTSNPIQDLVDANLLPPSLTIFGKGVRLRSSGLSMMSNDATFEAGLARFNGGNSMICGRTRARPIARRRARSPPPHPTNRDASTRSTKAKITRVSKSAARRNFTRVPRSAHACSCVPKARPS
jgi:hypothetical protein